MHWTVRELIHGTNSSYRNTAGAGKHLPFACLGFGRCSEFDEIMLNVGNGGVIRILLVDMTPMFYYPIPVES